MATINKALAKATVPYGLFEPRLFGRPWLKEFDRFFNRAEFPFAYEELELGWVPELEVFQKNNRLTVRLDVPGLKKEELGVHVTDNMLTVEGERKRETEEEKNHWYTRERTYGKFYRTVPLPEGVNVKEVAATFKDGVLEVTVPLHAAVTVPPHKVDVKEPEEKKVTVAA
jgi:HSP20 family protein